MALCDVQRWMEHPVTEDSLPEELTLLTWFLRLWRVTWYRGEAFLSMEDLFPIYFPLLSTPTGRREAVAATTEVFWCLAATEDVTQTNATSVRGLSSSCSASLRSAAAEWLTVLLDEDPSTANEACCCAALMFFADGRDVTAAGQIPTVGVLARRVLELVVSKRAVLEKCSLFDPDNSRVPSPTSAMFITSVLKSRSRRWRMISRSVYVD